ncbi:sphingomyelin phosphodiesterase [Herbihabitans rhizosphaerae]|uniref:Sphingomyelin phosphodiesterase n=1 Tax=Herbihabitans rhizosphaerae TaxID=1872711 RepID=A0A4Q7L597_9PSEU|nr:sphingomyelin phosphodiesterase [Herbihabitans rhizosphaerae]RZS44819.1 sphingomyelin phosphodiesterase [Herbihabitans rhizosphaerae]
MRIRFVFPVVVAAVAALVTAGQSSAEPAARAVAVAPKIASYNVFMLSRNLYPNWGQLARADLIDRQGVLDGQDVVVLNEAFDNAASDKLLANLADTYPNQTPVLGRSRTGWDATHGEYSDLTPEDGGVAVLSRWPISRKEQYVYADGCGADALANKGFVYVVLATPQGPLHVVGTHMQADDSLCGSPGAVRATQRAEIRKFLAARQIPAAEPVYVAGDMNVIEAGEEYPAMLRELGATAPTHTGHPHSWDCDDNTVCVGQYGSGQPSQHLDYVLPLAGHPAPAVYENETRRVKSPQWTVVGETYDDYSDHYPVFGAGQ